MKNIRKIILKAAPPLEWSNDKKHPIHTLGYYTFGMCDGFIYDKEKIEKAEEELLTKILGEIARYWYNQNNRDTFYRKYINL